MKKPQVADSFGKGTHDAKPGELEGIAHSFLRDARAHLYNAKDALVTLDRVEEYIIGLYIKGITKVMERFE